MSDVGILKTQDHDDHVEVMGTTSVDKVAALFLSLALMIGLAVVMLGGVYLVSTYKPEPLNIVIVAEERIAGRGDHAAGFERDLEAPGAEETEQVNEPSIEQTLQTITDTVTSMSATLDTVATSASGTGSGKGDSRPPGPEGEGDDIIPKFERWEIRFSARDLKSYAAQLDFFKIELAAVGAGRSEVDYASELSSGTPKPRSGKGEDEKRLYFINRREGGLLKYEKDLLSKAGVTVAGRQVLKLISKDLENELALLEMMRARKERGNDVKATAFGKTIFECQPKPTGTGFVWAIVEMRYRTPSR